MEYANYLKSGYWSRRAGEMKKKTNWKCQVCGSGGKLEVHHLSYKNLGNENDEELEVLCSGCHFIKHFGIDEAIDAFISS